MPVEHRKSSDPKHRHHVDSIKNFKCKTCGDIYSSYEHESRFCETCQAYSYLLVDTISSEKVKDIVNRQYIPSEEDEERRQKDLVKDRSTLWDDDLLERNVTGTVRPLSGKYKLRITGRRSKKLWLENTILVEVIARDGTISRAYFDMKDIALLFSKMI